MTKRLDMTVLKDPNRFHPVMDTIDRLPEIRNGRWSIPSGWLSTNNHER